jgi:hypothetical protein
MEEKKYVSEDNQVREATPEELIQFELDAVEIALTESSLLAKQEARTSALAKLAALGLTEEEIAAL